MLLHLLLKRTATISLWALGATLTFASVNLYAPYLMVIRGWSGGVLLVGGMAVLGALIVFGCWSRRGIRGKLLVVLWCLPPIAAASATTIMQRDRHDVIQANGAHALELGRRFIVGYSSYDEVAPLASRGLIAGIYITRHNIRGRTVANLRSEIAKLQALRRAANLPLLIVAADQEGGIVSHLSPPLTSLAALSKLSALPADERSRKAEDSGQIHGRELADLGVTLNLAPVIDLRRSRSRNRLDFHSLIGQRAISDDPAIAADIAVAYVRGLEAFGVNGTAKHFPGLGRIREDTHHFRARLDTPIAELETSDWIPFRQTLTQSSAFLMVGHVAVTAIDSERAASHSRRVIDDLIRTKWGYDGIIMTDDLVMGPIYQYGVCAAVVEALNAGVDLLLVAYDGLQFYRMYACALDASARGHIDRTAMQRSIARLNARAVKARDEHF